MNQDVWEANKMKVIIAYDGSTYAAAAIGGLPRAGIPPGSEVPVVSVADFSKARPAVSEFNLISATSRPLPGETPSSTSAQRDTKYDIEGGSPPAPRVSRMGRGR